MPLLTTKVGPRTIHIHPADAVRIGHERLTELVQGVIDTIYADYDELMAKLRPDEGDHRYVMTGDVLVFVTIERSTDSLWIDIYVTHIERSVGFKL